MLGVVLAGTLGGPVEEDSTGEPASSLPLDTGDTSLGEGVRGAVDGIAGLSPSFVARCLVPLRMNNGNRW